MTNKEVLLVKFREKSIKKMNEGLKNISNGVGLPEYLCYAFGSCSCKVCKFRYESINNKYGCGLVKMALYGNWLEEEAEEEPKEEASMVHSIGWKRVKPWYGWSK